MRLADLIVRGHRLGLRRQVLLARAAGVLAAASAAVRFLPFQRAIRFGCVPAMGRRLGEVGDQVWAVEAAARLLPVRAKCIEKGLAVQRLLRRRGVDAVLHYGVGRDAVGALNAHVWVSVDGCTVIGGEEAPNFRCVATYS